MKRYLSLLLALVLAFSLVACSKDGGTTKPETGQGETPSTGDKPEIKYLVLAGGTDIDEVSQKINERLEELNAGYTVKLVAFNWDQYGDKLPLIAKGAGSAEEQFDLATTASWLGPFKTLVAEETLYDMNQVIDEAAPELKKSLTDAQLKGGMVDGKLYGIQTVIDNAVMARDMFIWNLQELEKLGKTADDIKNIDNINDLEPLLKEYKEKFPEKYPMQGSKDGTWAERRLDNFIRTKADGSYEVLNYLASDELKAKFEKIADYRDKGYLHPDSGTEPFGEQQQEPDEWLVARGEGEPGSVADWENQKKVKVWSTPIADDNIVYNENIQGKMTSVYAHTKHPKEAVNFIERVKFDEKIQNLLAFGIEGKHYTLEDGKVAPIEGQEGWNPWLNQWSNDVRLPQTTSLDMESPQMKELIDKVNDIHPSVDLGFYPSPELQDKIAGVLARRDGIGELQNGHMDIYEKFVSGLEEAGVNEVVEELKAEFEAWYKDNK